MSQCRQVSSLEITRGQQILIQQISPEKYLKPKDVNMKADQLAEYIDIQNAIKSESENLLKEKGNYEKIKGVLIDIAKKSNNEKIKERELCLKKIIKKLHQLHHRKKKDSHYVLVFIILKLF